MSNENRHFWTLFSTSFKLKNNNHTKATKYKGFSELLFTFQPFPRRAFAWLSVQSFRLLSRAPPALSLNLLPIHSPDLLPACSPLSFFRISPFRLLNINTRAPRAARVHTPPARSRVALDYVVCQNVVLIWREVHVLQFLEGRNRFRVCRVKSGIMAKNPKVNLNVF